MNLYIYYNKRLLLNDEFNPINSLETKYNCTFYNIFWIKL